MALGYVLPPCCMAKLTVNDFDVRNKRVFVRVDYNVPMEEKDGQMVITDATRIKETLPTLELLINKGAKIILAAHLGRPKGKREPSMSLRPVAEKLADMLVRHVAFVDDCIGEKVEKTANALKPGRYSVAGECAFLQRGGGERSGFRGEAGACGGCLRERRVRRGASRACFDRRRGARRRETRRDSAPRGC